jgi:predicted amidohydrolase YtcJ
MVMRICCRAALLCAGVVLSLAWLHGEERAGVESIFYGGRVYTLDDGVARAEAIAVRDGIILAVGTDEEMLALAEAGTRRIDLGGRAVIPGLTDAHAHFIGYAEFLGKVDLVGTGSIAEVQDRLRERIEGGAKDSWIVGRGWDQNDWSDRAYPDRKALDDVSLDMPIYIKRVCGHAAVANSKALRLAGIDENTPDPSNGILVRDADGYPTGLLFEEAKGLVERVIPPLKKESKKELMRRAASECLSVGLVGVHEMGIDQEDLAVYEELFSAGQLPLRITVYYDGESEGLSKLLERGPFRGYNGYFSIVGVKLYADGSLGARSAALLEDYADDPGNRGILTAGTLFENALRWHEAGFQVAIHAIGDRGVRAALDALEEALRRLPAGDSRHRIEHAQVVAPADIGRFAELGVMPSMQFTHCTSDMPWAADRLGDGRIETAYAWRSFLDLGNRIPGGSDFPVESINPFLGLYAAVTRKDLSGEPPGGWNSGQCLTIEEALAAFTIDAAYAAHQEEERGSISPGKFADFIVLSDDIMQIDASAIPRVRVLMTVLSGEIVFRSGR